MTTNMYIIYDKVSDVLIGPIILERSHAAAIRGFNEVLKAGRTENIFSQHPADFELWYLGTINLQDGALTKRTGQATITTGAEWLKTQK